MSTSDAAQTHDQRLAEAAAPIEPVPGTETSLDDLSDSDISFLVAVPDKTLQLDPKLSCPLKADAVGWRTTLDTVFGGSFPSADASKAHGIARGTYKESVSKEVAAPCLEAWRRSSVWGDEEHRFVLQPISKSHYIVDLKECGSTLHANYPPKLMERWVEAVKVAAEQVRR